MSNVALRAFYARENLDQTPLTPEEQLLIAPPDVQEADPEVAAVIAEDKADDLLAATTTASDDADEIGEISTTLQEAGSEVTPVAVALAAERLNAIYKRYGFKPAKRISREDIDAIEPEVEAQVLIDEAQANQEVVVAIAEEGIKEIANKIAVNARNFFKWRTTFVKDVQAVVKAAADTKGTPSASALYSNAVRIAHFTDFDGNVLSTAKDINTIFSNGTAQIGAVRELTDQLTRTFSFFDKNSGVFDFDKMMSSFDKLHIKDPSAIATIGNNARSLGAGIYGEDYVMANIPTGKSDDRETLLKGLADVSFSSWRAWSVSDRKDVTLPVMSAKEVESNAKALIDLAAGLVGNYNVLERIQSTGFVADPVGFSGVLTDFLASPSLFVKYRANVLYLIRHLTTAMDEAIDLKAKALSCLLDYYKWSLKNHKAAE